MLKLKESEKWDKYLYFMGGGGLKTTIEHESDGDTNYN